MVKSIVHDVMRLQIPSKNATSEDLSVAFDLLDTLRANQSRCVGLAANMIGVSKRIIAVQLGPVQVAMLNPVIVSREGVYEAEEGCLSLKGTRKTKRYEKIVVAYQDVQMKKHKGEFSGFPAQIIQHEIDHCDGILI